MDSSLPVVSIISPAFNHEKYIAQCVASVQGQTYPHWEMLILDDGSTDNTYKIALELSSQDPRIHVFTQENIGVFRLGETYNKGLRNAKGRYIAILECDDLWEPQKLEKQVAILENDGDIIMSWGMARVADDELKDTFDVRPVFHQELRDLYNNIPTGSIVRLLAMGSFIPALSLLIRRDVLDGIGGFIQSHGLPLIDFTTELHLSLKGKFHFHDEILGVWRIYPTQTTKKYAVQMFRGFTSFLREHLPQVQSLTQAEKNQIMNYYQSMGLVAYARSGRYMLIRREFKSARQDYIRSIFFKTKGKWLWRLRALVGYLMSLLHLDVEWIADLLGKKKYK